MSIYKKGIRSYGKGLWQGKLFCDNVMYYIKAKSRQEAEAKMKSLIKGYAMLECPITKESIHKFLLQQGFTAGMEREAVPETSKKAYKLTANTWRATFLHLKKRLYVIGVSEEETAKKLTVAKKGVGNGLCEGTMDGVHQYLIESGFEFGRFSGEKREQAPKKQKSEPFKNGIRMRADGRYEGRYTYNKKPESIYGHSRTEVNNQLKSIKGAIADGSYIGKNTETFSGFLMHWLKKVSKEGLSPATAEGYRSYIINHIIPYFNDTGIQQIDTDDLQKFFNDKKISGRKDGKEGGLSYKTRRNIRNMLSKSFTYAVYKKVIATNPVIAVVLRYEQSKAIEILDMDESDRFLEYCLKSEHPYALGVAILLKTGIRIGELCGLRMRYVDRKTEKIIIQHSLRRMVHPNKHQVLNYERINLEFAREKTRTGLYLGPPKTESSKRNIPFNSTILECIQRLIAFQEELLGQPLSECENGGEDRFLLVSYQLGAVEPRVFHDYFKKFLEEAALKDVRVHSTRHTWITNAITKFPSEVANIQEIAGHNSQATTWRYNHANENKKASLMDKL